MNSIKVKSGKLKRNGSVAILIRFFNNAESLIKQNSQAVFGRIEINIQKMTMLSADDAVSGHFSKKPCVTFEKS